MSDEQTTDQKLKHWRDKFAELANTLPRVPLEQLTAEQLAELQAATDAIAQVIETKLNEGESRKP